MYYKFWSLYCAIDSIIRYKFYLKRKLFKQLFLTLNFNSYKQYAVLNFSCILNIYTDGSKCF